MRIKDVVAATATGGGTKYGPLAAAVAVPGSKYGTVVDHDMFIEQVKVVPTSPHV
jgi:hypothetical protein